MVNKLVLVSALIVMMLFVSGCTDGQNPDSGQENNVTDVGESADIAEMSAEDLTTIDNLPEGYEYLGAPTLAVEEVRREYVNSSGITDTSEGFYKADSVDLYIDVIELESPEMAEEFVSGYRSGFKELASGTRFAEEDFNGHSAVRIKTYSTVGGEQVPRYTYIWSNDRFVFVVGGATEDYTMLRTLAEATGY